MYDVIVVGAGPAGCTASKALAEKDCKVLLVEKFKMKNLYFPLHGMTRRF